MNDNPNIKKGRKCRLTEEFKESFYDAFLKTGSIKESCQACNIAIPTYNKWLAKYPDFKELVNKAKLDRVKNGVDELPDLKSLAQEYVLDIFLGKKFKYKYKQVITKDGSIEELEEREQVIASDALIERALGKQTESIPAIVFQIGDVSPTIDRQEGDESEILELLNLDEVE